MSETQTTPTPATGTTLPVSVLQANPKNVRRNLRLTDWLIESVRENGVKIPIVVLPSSIGYVVTQGHRRLAAAERAGIDEVPVFILDPERREEGEDYIDQVIENAGEGREPLTALEQADALFLAEQSGMSRTKVAKRTGRTRSEVEKAVTASGQIGTATRGTLAGLTDYEFTLDVLAALGEFDEDPAAVERLIDAHGNGMFEHQLVRERIDRADAQAREAKRAELEAAGITVVDDPDTMPEDWAYVEEITDGRITDEEHAACPGHRAIWNDDAGPAVVEFVCTDPDAFHRPPEPEPQADEDPEGTTGDEDSTGDEVDQEEDEADDRQDSAPAPAAWPSAPRRDEVAYKLKLEGNKAWRAAAAARRDWLRELLMRKTAPKPVLRWVVEQTYRAPKPVQVWTGDVARVAILADLLGRDKQSGDRTEWIDPNATPGRLALLMLAPYAAAFEKRIEASNVWRTDKPEWDTPDIRRDACTWLTFLSELGYPLSRIEQAVIADEAYTLEAEKEQDEIAAADDGSDGEQHQADDDGDGDEA
ncbi:ParB/RepB/Spo0J family partition protein [Streptomyces sp. NPDC088354]|uniref:ParB/RepB/Spo0J family partition protein n=1 Tax=Streptomyces sp. NPDC088354 TaxID=3365856 RepID=UPI00380905A9